MRDKPVTVSKCPNCGGKALGWNSYKASCDRCGWKGNRSKLEQETIWKPRPQLAKQRLG